MVEVRYVTPRYYMSDEIINNLVFFIKKYNYEMYYKIWMYIFVVN
jgi:hypothetical protein